MKKLRGSNFINIYVRWEAIKKFQTNWGNKIDGMKLPILPYCEENEYGHDHIITGNLLYKVYIYMYKFIFYRFIEIIIH